MSSIIGPIGQEQLELFGLELWKIAAFDFVYSQNIYKYKPVSTKLGHNEYEHKISDEFDYGSSQLVFSVLEIEQEGHDGPVSFHWLILGNLFKTWPQRRTKIGSHEF